MKFCRWTLFKIYEELKDISDENKQSFDSKSRTLTHFVAFEEVYGRQASLADVVHTATVLGFYMRRINYDSSSNNINVFVFIEQRNISFQNDISLIIKP